MFVGRRLVGCFLRRIRTLSLRGRLYGLLGLDDMLCSGVVNLQPVCGLLDCLLLLMNHMDELTAFQRVHSLVASLDPASGRLFRLVTRGSCSGLGLDITNGC